MADRSATTAWVRSASYVALIGGIIIGALDVMRGIQSTSGDRLALILQGAAVAVGLSALAAIAAALAVLIEQRAAGSSDSSGSQAILTTLGQIHDALDLLPANLSTLIAINGQDASPHRPSPVAAIPTDLTKAMERMVELLGEVRDAAMLDESQRQARQKALAEQHKGVALADAASAIEGRQWGKAGKLLAALEADFPNDAGIAELHRRLDAGRAAQAGESIDNIRARVEDLMAISSWDEAYSTALELAENFPENAAATSLLARVTRERDLFNESTVHQLYEEIKADLERRRWRRALAGVQRLVDRFPEHRKTVKMRAQIKTIQTNAEIEERQEQEARIQELIRAKRFAEAIELAEDLLDRFPLSPQAESLEELLPKMRDLAMQKDIEAETSGSGRNE
jgi:hypothetical protein